MFTVTDKAPSSTQSYTNAKATFTSAGILNTVQSTRAMLVTRVAFSETYIDPLAESFFINSKEFPNGMFLDSVDVYFNTKAENLPVILQIRPMVNGYPSSTDILPFSQVTLSPSQVNLPANPYNPLPSDRTRFKFSAPVYLSAGDYCFVLLSTTTEYNVYTASMGRTCLGSNNIISKQPYIGSMFKSQNASTWTPSQESDIMFRLNKCVFDTNATDVVFTNTIDVNQGDVFNYHEGYVAPSVLEFSSADTNWFQKAIPSGGVLESNFTAINTDMIIAFDTEYQIEGDQPNQLSYKATMATTDANVSPVIDLERCFSIFTKNVINNDLTDETVAKMGKASAKYETRPVTLASGFESQGLNITFDAYLPSISDVYVYYKAANTGNQINFDQMGWTLIGNTSNSVQSQVNRADTTIPYTEYNIKTTAVLPSFNLYSIKLVMVGNGTNVPLIKDLRVVAFS
jgi:hypothetical protein